MKKFLILFGALAFFSTASAQEGRPATGSEKIVGEKTATHSNTAKKKQAGKKSSSNANGSQSTSQGKKSNRNEASTMESSSTGSGSTGSMTTIDTHNGTGSTRKKNDQ